MPSLLLALSLSLSSAAMAKLVVPSHLHHLSFSRSKFSSLCHLIVLQRPSCSVQSPRSDSFYISFFTCLSVSSFSEAIKLSNSHLALLPYKKMPSPLSIFHRPSTPLSPSSPNLSVSFYISLNQRKQRGALSLHSCLSFSKMPRVAIKQCENNKL